ncbi:MAG TPA: hypothetical protein VLH38_04225 [Patescibacteria group bacterium]|nr:hypothetical protein [Patescibacteria group bacterium]
MEQKQAIAERLKQSNNILVTVSNNPSVDQLASCIGLTLALNKMGKHATAVFSGIVPSTIEFLQPEKTIEKNTDSLRDFIIALDKAKADKLRYKVEDKVVKIFITPYKTSITNKDLDFSQGDFNVDVVLAVGVHLQTDLDQAITSHGRILHDAAVATINTKPGGELGTINWLEPTASSLSELGVQLIDAIDKSMIDGQMATAFLTGIVAETNRFSNEKTTPGTMSISAELMAAGANQQLVATKLEEPPAPPPAPVEAVVEQRTMPKEEETHTSADGTLEIAHNPNETPEPTPVFKSEPEFGPASEKPDEPKIEQLPQLPPPMPEIRMDEHLPLPSEKQGDVHIDNHTNEPLLGGSTNPTQHMASSHMILQPPAMGGEMSANATPQGMGNADPLSLPQPNESVFGPSSSANITAPEMPYMPPSMTPSPTPAPVAPPAPILPPAPSPEPPAPLPTQPSPPAVPPILPPQAPQGETLSQIETDVNSPHLQASPLSSSPTLQFPAPQLAPATPAVEPQGPDLASARDAVMQAIATPAAPEPIQALNAQPLGNPLHEQEQAPVAQAPINYDATANPTFTLPDAAPVQPPSGAAPPPVPPPMMPPTNFGA